MPFYLFCRNQVTFGLNEWWQLAQFIRFATSIKCIGSLFNSCVMTSSYGDFSLV
jgi:hypothetical protein